MIRTVILSKTAKKKLEKQFEYLLKNWNTKVKNDFIKKLDRNIHLIRTTPDSFPNSQNKKGISKCVITKHTILLFRYTAETITILTFFDTRQDPKKLKREL